MPVFLGRDMLALGKLKHLRRLNITINPFFFPLSPTLTDKEFTSIVENWHELEDLKLDYDRDLSITSLISLGQNCPRLKRCYLCGGEFYMDYWQIENFPRPMFPVIETLSLVEKYGEDSDDRGNISR